MIMLQITESLFENNGRVAFVILKIRYSEEEEVYLSPLASKKKQSQGFDKQIRYTNGNWEAAKGPSRSSSRAATRIAFLTV